MDWLTLAETAPDKVSVQLQVTVTSTLFHPLAFGAGVRLLKVIVGGVASRLIVTDCELVPPALVAVQVKVVPAVSVLIVVELHPVLDVMLDSGSVTLQVTVTSLVYQPFVPKVPETLGVMTGGVVSVGTLITTAPC